MWQTVCWSSESNDESTRTESITTGFWCSGRPAVCYTVCNCLLWTVCCQCKSASAVLLQVSWDGLRWYETGHLARMSTVPIGRVCIGLCSYKYAYECMCWLSKMQVSRKHDTILSRTVIKLMMNITTELFCDSDDWTLYSSSCYWCIVDADHKCNPHPHPLPPPIFFFTRTEDLQRSSYQLH